MQPWTIEEKAEMFDKLAMHFYRQNFGTFSKGDTELLMFNFLLENEIRSHSDGAVLNYNAVSDYKLSKILGITQQKVRNLKIKKQLIYPIEFDWKHSLAGLIENARYDKETKKIILSIPDPNLLIEIQNFIEERGGYFTIQSNNKLLQLRIEYFLELTVLVDDSEKAKKKIIKRIKNEIQRSEKHENDFDEKSIGRSLIDIGVFFQIYLQLQAKVMQSQKLYLYFSIFDK